MTDQPDLFGNMPGTVPPPKPKIGGERLTMRLSDKRGICPRCHTFIGKNSPIVRLAEPEEPWSDDGRSCWRTGGHWYYDGRVISMHPRSWVHWRCYVDVMVEECACVYCGDEGDMTVDHVIPKRYGGTDQPRNLVPACRSCNSRKGTLPAELVGADDRTIDTWLRDRGWLPVGKASGPWRNAEGRTFTRAVAIRVAAWGGEAS